MRCIYGSSLRTILFALLVLAGTLSAGCVRPWERGTLERIQERLDGHDATRSYEAHLWMVREGAMGGQGKAGGGCGCN